MKNFLLATLMLVSVQINAQDFWEEVSTPLTRVQAFHCINETDLLLGGYNDNTAGLFVSENSGQTWQRLDLTSYNWDCSFIENYNGSILAFVGPYLFKKQNLYNWIQIVDNQTAGRLLMINDTIIFKGHWEGVEKTIDGGYNWENVYTSYSNENVEDIIQHTNGDLYFGTYCSDGLSSPGVYKSSDTGETWNHIGLENYYVGSLATDSHGNIYAGIIGHHTTYEGGLFKSQDLGVTWEKIFNEGYVNSIVITPEDSIFLGSNNGVYRSGNRGNTWMRIIDGLSYPAVSNLSIGGDGHIYAIIADNDDRLFRSTNSIIGIQKTNNYPTEAFVLYPNPAANELHISHPRQQLPASAAIINMQGQIIAQQPLQLPGTLSISHLPSGIYMLRLQTGTTKYTQQFIKN